MRNLLFIISFSLLLAACGAGAPGTEESEILAERDKVTDDILSKIGTASCTSDTQCGALPMGAKSCGGPSSFLAYSSAESDTTVLLQLAEKHHDLSEQLNEIHKMHSNCALELTPAVACENSICTLQPLVQILPTTLFQAAAD